MEAKQPMTGGAGWRSTSAGLVRLAFLLLAGCVQPGSRADEAAICADIAIEAVSIIDVETGRVLEDQSILISGETITHVIPPGLDIRYDAAKRVDGRGLYAIPGLWDMHDHHVKEEPLYPWDTYDPGPEDTVRKDIFLPLYVAFGVTGIREMSGNEVSLKIKGRLERRDWLGPDYIVGSPLLDGPFPVFPGVDVIALASPEEARAEVRRLKAEGYDFLKPFSMLQAETYRALTDEAARIGMEVAGELPLSISAREAADRGQRSIEHLTGFELACASNEAALRADYRRLVDRLAAGDENISALMLWNRSEWEPIPHIDEARCSQLLAHLASRGTWVTPTLIVQKRISRPDPAYEKDNPDLRYMANMHAEHEDLVAQFDPDRNLIPTYDFRSQYIDDLVAAGVGVLAGSDDNGAYPLHEELALFVESGLSPLQALQTATINPARFLGRSDELGSIAPGRRADIVLLMDSPLENIRHTKSVAQVFLKGVHFDRLALDRMLEQTASDAARLPDWLAEQKASENTAD